MLKQRTGKENPTSHIALHTSQKGITLIALVITIIVMLILVGVSVTVALNGGLFTTAKEAAEGTASKRNEELELSSGKVEINGEWYNSIDEYVKGGSSNNPEDPTEPENPTGYTAYSIGDEVTVGGENFYVIADSDETQEKVTLLAKDNINTKTLLQTTNATGIEFSETNYWSGAGDLIETGEPDSSHYAAKVAYDYGAKVGGTGRLMTRSEATALITANSDILYGTNGKSSSEYLKYWLGCATSRWNLNYVHGEQRLIHEYEFGMAGYYCVRPVVEISKSLIS